MTKMDVFTEQLALSEIEVTFFTAKIDQTTPNTRKYWEYVELRNDALLRVRSCKFLMKQEKLREQKS